MSSRLAPPSLRLSTHSSARSSSGVSTAPPATDAAHLADGAVTSLKRVVAATAVQQVGARPAVNRVVAILSVEPVGEVAADEDVRSGAAVDVVNVRGDTVALSGLAVVRAPVAGNRDAGDAIRVVNQVETVRGRIPREVTTRHPVWPGSPIEKIVSGASRQDVRSCVPEQRVIETAAVEVAVAASAGDADGEPVDHAGEGVVFIAEVGGDQIHARL